MQIKNITLLLKMLAHDDGRIKVQLKEDISRGQHKLSEILLKIVVAIEEEVKKR